MAETANAVIGNELNLRGSLLKNSKPEWPFRSECADEFA